MFKIAFMLIKYAFHFVVNFKMFKKNCFGYLAFKTHGTINIRFKIKKNDRRKIAWNEAETKN